MRIGRFARPIIFFALLGAVLNVSIAWALQSISASRPICSSEQIRGAAGGSGPSVWLVTLVDRVGEMRINRLAHNTEWAPILTEQYKESEDQQARIRIDRFIPKWSTVRSLQPALTLTTEDHFSRAQGGTELAAGWPLHSLWSECDEFWLHFRLNMARFPESFEIEEDAVRWTEKHDGEAFDVDIPAPKNTLLWGLLVRAEARPTPIPRLHPRHTEYDTIILSLRPIWPGFVANTLIYGMASWLLVATPVMIRRTLRARRGRCVRCNYNLRGVDHERCPECGRAVSVMHGASAG